MATAARVFPVLFDRQQALPVYCSVRALEGVLAPGKRVEFRDAAGAWQPARVVEPWPHGLGSIVCLEPGAGDQVRALDREEWLRRYRQRFITVAGLTEQQAQACAAAETFETLSDGFEDDPEGAADSEMSYWDGD